jgi:lipopolysaccharide export system permease protein
VRIHDRYILSGFWRNLGIGLIAFTVIYITVDVSEQIDVYIDNHVHLNEVLLYYGYKVPSIVALIMPVAVLLATIFTMGRLSRENELTALISSGTPLVRVGAPIILSAALISVGMIAADEFLIAKASHESLNLKRIKIDKQMKETSSFYRDNVHYQGENGRTYYGEHYDVLLKAFTNIAVYEYRGDSLVRRIDAAKAYWDGSQWIFLNGAIREFTPAGEKISTFAKMDMNLPERPEDFAKEELDPDEMNYRQLKAYIAKAMRSGESVDKYRVDLYFKFSFPFTSAIFAVIGAALSSAKRKPSMATGFGLTLFISFTYYTVLRIGQSLGHSGVIGPVLGAWMGNIAFVIVGGVLLYRANR